MVVVPARTGTDYGLDLRPGHPPRWSEARARAGLHRPPERCGGRRAGDVYIAEATAQRVQVVRPTGPRRGRAGGRHGTGGLQRGRPHRHGRRARRADRRGRRRAGDVFIADTANCRVRVLAARTATVFGQAMTAGHLYTVAGTGVCGTAGQGGPVAAAQLWDPVAVAVDSAGDLLVADNGDQSVLLAPPAAGPTTAPPVGAGDIGVVVGGTGSYGPYLADGLSATGETAELNDPRGLALGPTGALFVTDGFMHVIRVVPSSTGVLDGRTMKAGDLYRVAGAVPVATARDSGTAPAGCSRGWGHRSASRCPRRAPSTTATAVSTRYGWSAARDMSRFGRRTFLASSTGIGRRRRRWPARCAPGTPNGRR